QTQISHEVSGANPITQSPNGTRPTKLVNVSVTSVSRTQMRVSGKYTGLSGAGIAGMAVYVYDVSEANFSRWYTMYTDNNGNFNATMTKIPSGDQIQIEVEGNGAYSRPYPTYPRP